MLPSGKLTLMSHHPNALMVDLSAVHMAWAFIASKVMNLVCSGQKCEVAPESMIVPPRPTWTEAAVANALMILTPNRLWNISKVCVMQDKL
jgi:hypothetical protein